MKSLQPARQLILGVTQQSGAYPMTGSIQRGRVTVAAALILLVALSFGIYYLGRVLGRPWPSSEDTFWFLFAAPLLAIGGWWGYPRAAWCILAAYGLLALLCAYFSVVFLVVPLLFADKHFPDVGLVLMASAFGLSAALFAAVCYVLAFSASVRDFGNYRLDLQQEALRKRQEVFRKRQEEKG
jgi:hypothetical protein